MSSKKTIGLYLFSFWWYAFFWLCQILTLLLLPPYLIFWLLGQVVHTSICASIKDSYTHTVTSAWARLMIWAAGGRVRVLGLENLPAGDNILFVSNHQGSFDIPIILGYIPRLVGFVSKKEMAKMPIVSTWMKALHCVFLDREDRRSSLATMTEAAEHIQRGHPLVIFPEGTISSGSIMKTFKPGSFKLATLNDAFIVPLTINGSYLWRELHGGLVQGKQATLNIHPAFKPSQQQSVNVHELAKQTQDIIASVLPQNTINQRLSNTRCESR